MKAKAERTTSGGTAPPVGPERLAEQPPESAASGPGVDATHLPDESQMVSAVQSLTEVHSARQVPLLLHL